MKNLRIYLEAYSFTGSSYYDSIEDYIVSPITYSYGFGGIKVTDRVADTGTLKFSLNNRYGYFAPPRWTGWKKNTWVVLTVLYGPAVSWNDPQNIFRQCFVGKIDTLVEKYPVGGIPTVDVTVVDVMSDFVNLPLPLQGMRENETFYTATSYLTSLVSKGTNYSGWYVSGSKVGASDFVTFPTVFDADGKMTVQSEMYKMAISELGYAYITQRNSGAGINIENSDYRATAPYTLFPVYTGISGSILTEASETIVQEDGSRLKLNEATYTNMSDTMQDFKIEYGTNIINTITVKGYPRDVSSASAVLFNYDKVMMLFYAEPVYIKVTYSDPEATNATRIAGSSMSYPTPYIDYVMNTDWDGSGSDETSYLAVTVVDESHTPAGFGAWSCILKLESSLPVIEGYVTKLQLRGKPIYYWNPTEALVDNDTSISSYGVHAATLDQKYIEYINDSETFANAIITKEKDPRTILRSITFIPNTSISLMNSFIYNDVGDKIHVKITETGIDKDYFIHKIDTTIDLSGVINCTWGLIEA